MGCSPNAFRHGLPTPFFPAATSFAAICAYALSIHCDTPEIRRIAARAFMNYIHPEVLK
jgi:hypothetical protein